MLKKEQMAPLGHTTWHTSDEEGGGPDVGISMILPDGSELYFGELHNTTLEDDGINPAGVGWVIAHYVNGERNILATKCAEGVHEDDRVERLAASMEAPSPPETST